MEQQEMVVTDHRLQVSPASQGNVHTYFLDYTIEDMREYRELSTILLNAPPTDTIRLMINGYGGWLDSAIQLCNLIQTTEAHVEAHLLGEASSAHGMIALACHSWITYPTSRLMLHTYSGGTGGKAPDIRAHVEADTARMKSFLETVALNFCTPEEIHDMLENSRDMWFQGEDLFNRLNRLHDSRMVEEKQLELAMLNQQRELIEAALAEHMKSQASIQVDSDTGSATITGINIDQVKLNTQE